MRKIIFSLLSLFLFLSYVQTVFAQGVSPIDDPFSSTSTSGFDPCPGGTCKTGLGIGINAGNASDLIATSFGIILAMSGGVAVILIIISGYQMMASGGNPEKVQAAREGLISAITGLLFIIFSLVILELIGVSILHIPGFTK